MSVTEKRVKLTETVDATRATSGEESEWLEREDHPLLNDLILETLFGFVRRFDLKASRVVSKKWNVRTLPHMRSTFKVTIHGTQSSAKDELDQDTRRIDDFVRLFSSNQWGIPFAKFELEPFQTTEGVGQQFIQLCGETSTEIDLGYVEIVYIIEDVSALLRGCPNIQALDLPINLISRSGNLVKLFPDSMPTFSSLKDITFPSDYEKERLKFCPSFIEELMTASPNISQISVFEEEDEENEIQDDGRNINVLLDSIEKLGRESSIQSLCFHNATIEDIEHLQRMAKNGLKLKSLTVLAVNATEVAFDTLQMNLATCFKESLEYIEVFESVDNILIEFPNMPKLKSLSQRIIPNFESKGINVNENFPALETLSVDFDDPSQENLDWDEFFTGFDPCPTIKSLVVLQNYMRIHMFHNFLMIFPNLTKLDLKVKDDGVEVVRQIWTHMPQLESLNISGSIERSVDLFFDSLFTGIPTVVLKSIRNVGDYLEKRTAEERRDNILKYRDEYSRLPSILNLTKLRHLDLHITGAFHLTDVSAYLAFYSMNHLHRLNIRQCEFTRTSCDILTRETGLETWNFQHFKDEKLEYIIPHFFIPDRDQR